MQRGTHEPSDFAAIRIVATPVPPRRLYAELTLQLRAMYDDLLTEPVPGHLLARLTPPNATTPPAKETSRSERYDFIGADDEAFRTA
jgi:hypothetical protein